MAIEALETHKWIPVEERLPVKHGTLYDMCIVSIDGGEVCFGVYRDDEKKWYTRLNEGEKFYNNAHMVRAWMPIPEPYKPKKESDKRGTQS